MEVLGLSSRFYNFMYIYIDNPSYTHFPSTGYLRIIPFSSTLVILSSGRTGSRFDSIPNHPGAIGIVDNFKQYEEAMLEHRNKWLLSNSTA